MVTIIKKEKVQHIDYFVLQLINLTNETDIVTIEGIEDVDITSEDGLVAIQCKYCEKTEYNHSVIASL